MNGILTDIRKAVELARVARRARVQGEEIVVQLARHVPVVRFGCWGFTIEGSLFHGDLQETGLAVREVFGQLDEETQRSLTFAPKAGGWVERARFWQRTLKPVLPSGQYHEAMVRMIDWYIQCVKRRLRERLMELNKAGQEETA